MIPAALLAGVDAGATTVRAGVADRPERVLARTSARAVRLADGAAQLATLVAHTVRDALSAAGAAGPARALVVGAAGASDRDAVEALLHALRATGIAARQAVITDAELVLADAFGDGAGIALIAGTGSIAMGRLPNGNVVRAGGLGPATGDRGSGYAIGRTALATADADLLRVLRAPEADTLWSPSTSAEHATPAEVASLAPAVVRAAAAGAPAARRIIDAAVDDLANLAMELVTRFEEREVDVALAGGVLTDPWFRQRVAAELMARSPQVRPVSDQLDAVRGALWLATRLASREPTIDPLRGSRG